MRAIYPDRENAEIAKAIGRSYKSVLSRANRLGLKKSPEHIAMLHATKCAVGKFGHGRPPWNKGLKGYFAPGSEKYQFKLGNRPHTWRPIGTREKHNDGIWYEKVTDGQRPGYKNFRPVHQLIWEQHHGPIPTGHIVVFLDRNPDHLSIDNLESRSRAEHMRRNSRHRLCPALKEALTWKSRLTRVINQLEKQHEKQTERSA